MAAEQSARTKCKTCGALSHSTDDAWRTTKGVPSALSDDPKITHRRDMARRCRTINASMRK